jgi:adenine deaminase
MRSTDQIIEGQLIDVHERRIYPSRIKIAEGIIQEITPIEEAPAQFILPGFVDAHVHIESSMLLPAAFGRQAVTHGTVATISDPHEIANVLGLEGVQYMLENATYAPIKIFFGAPSCVPATQFETSGAILSASDVEHLLERDDIYYLSEMMNFPGVISSDPEVMAKIDCAKRLGKVVDGHAPGLRGHELYSYVDAGISTDHESYSLNEALEKLNLGMKILIREGSAAKNYDALHPLIERYPDRVMFCTDDLHPDDLLIGHINRIVVRSLKNGYDLFDVLQIACVNPILHYSLPVGLLRQGDHADFIIVDDISKMEVKATFVKGLLVYEKDTPLSLTPVPQEVNNFRRNPVSPEDFRVRDDGRPQNVIQAIDGELITTRVNAVLPSMDGKLVPDIAKDILKISVVNRYFDALPAVSFIMNMGITRGAFASTVAHDSHNIIVVGTSDAFIARAVNELIKVKGGLCAVMEDEIIVLPLPVAGLMSLSEAEEVGSLYSDLDRSVKEMGSQLRAPFMTLSFMALLVIPELKLSDKGLFDVSRFAFV